MVRRLSSIFFLTVLPMASSTAFAYGEGLAASYAELFASVAGPKVGKEFHFITPEALVDRIKAREPIVSLDVRTPAETAIFAFALPGSLAIPLNELFLSQNLIRIPRDRPVVVLCQSAALSSAAGTALRHIGFDNRVYTQGRL